MTTRWSTVTLAAAGVLSVLFGARRAAAGNPCIGDAKEQFLECRAQCKEDYQIAKDDCLDRDHACVEICRAERSECRDATPLDEDLAACNATLYTAKQRCRDENPSDPDALDRCIDGAQVVAFQCRDAARERSRPALKACRSQFRACAEACPPGSSSVTDPAQCRLEAKEAFIDCRGLCREDFQFQKDVCRNRDHACVEQCRAERDGCRQPIEVQLAADIAACNATRDQQVEACHEAFEDGTSELDQCIDNAQVVAFQCRDAKREAARPGFAACRDAFRSCAARCPPVS